ncbi:MAG: hypothetical protein KF773_02840 [Deltaproteobacteria bacterium]|nr:hypothetical protein [Deltaproteobacteria bacterium]
MRRALVLLVLVACGGKPSVTPPDGAPDSPPPPDAPTLPVFRNPVDLPDAQLATEALQLLGANVPGARSTCQQCHGMTRQHVRYWRALSDVSMSDCLTDLQVTSKASAQQMIDCARSMPAMNTSDFTTKHLGIYATAANLPWFAYTFYVAYGGQGPAKLVEFQKQVGMPRDQTPFTQGEFDILAEWFARGVPLLDETLPLDPPPETCNTGISAAVGAHVADMAITGWRAVNKANMLAMHGCGEATDPRDCLSDTKLAVEQPFGSGWELPGRGRLRLLADVSYSTSFWTRSSADGRFIAHGVRNVPGSFVYDLQRAMPVPIDVLYDPSFFPDNSGFVFQGGPRNVCAQSVLTSNPAAISMTEVGCARLNSIGLYQHVGRALNGGDFFAVDSEFVSDDGGHNPTFNDPAAHFNSQGYASFTPMIFDGTRYVPRPHVEVATPYEGDAVLSPSAKLLITRVAGPNDRQLGFVLRKVEATLVGNTYQMAAPEVARYCGFSGGKPAFTFDERWVAFHHYVSQTDQDAIELGFTGVGDPGFLPYRQKGAANVYLLEIATGQVMRVTNVKPGQYALFPHFRSDNWMYIQVRDNNAGREYMIASDVALVLP